MRSYMSIIVIFSFIWEGREEDMVTEAEKKAQKKYDSQFDVIRFRVPKGKREVIQKFAERHGESVNQMINRLIDEEMNE